MSIRLLTAAVAGAVLLAGQVLAEDLVRVKSAHTVSVTMDRLAAAVEKAGAKVFARIDHAKGAASVGAEIPANQMLLFGSPKIGTPAIKDAAGIGLDLPLRASAYQDGDGQVWLVYRKPAAVGAAFGLPADHGAIAKMTGALGKLSAAATK